MSLLAVTQFFAQVLAQTSSQTPALPEGADDPVALIALGLGGLVLVYLLFLRPKARQGKSKRKDPLATPPSQRRSSLSAERSAERQMQSLLVELEKMSRQMSAQLDTKAAKLDALIREAEEKTTALNAALARAKAGQMADDLAGGTAGGRGNESVESGLAALARHRDIYDLADAGESAGAIAHKLHRPAGEVELILALRGSGGR